MKRGEFIEGYTLEVAASFFFSLQFVWKKNYKFITVYKLYIKIQTHSIGILEELESHGWRSLVGCSPWGLWESDMTEWLHFHFSLSCIGKGNGNPLQCSCLESPRDGGAWWAAVYGVAQSWTRLKRLSSSSNLLSLSEQFLTCYYE